MKTISRLVVRFMVVPIVAASIGSAVAQQGEQVSAPNGEDVRSPAAPPSDSQPSGTPPSDTPPSDGEPQLQFSFSSAAWSDVLQWFSEQADLSLQLDDTPTGTFSFSDPTRTYSPSESLDVINLALMKRGYSLVRRGRMLQVIDLETENADKLISEIAELVRPEDLEQRGKTDIVSCVMPLGSLTAEAAREELAQIVGPWGRVVVLESARQVKVTETAEKLIAIRDLLKSAAMADTKVIEIVLKHRSSDELLEIARPLLGLEPGETSNEEIRISLGLYGDRIYAAGLPGKTGLLQALIEKADQPLQTIDSQTVVADPILQTHAVTSADSTTVFDVLQTLLAGTPEARISIEPKSKAIIAWARPETHTMIQETIAKLEGRGQEFKVIDLRRLDPTQALLTINKFFGVTETGGEGPTVDGDPATGKLWVRGTAEQIALVERLLAELEGTDAGGQLGEKVRILPYVGSDAQAALKQVEQVWSITGRKNQIRTIAPSNSQDRQEGIRERRVPRPANPAPEAPPANPVRETPPSDAGEPGPANSLSQASPRRGAVGFVPRYHLVMHPADPPSFDASAPSNQSTSNQSTSNQSTSNQSTDIPVSDSPSTTVANRDSDGGIETTTISVGGADIIVQFTPSGMMIASEDLEALDAFESLMESFAEPSADQSDLPTIIWLKYIKADIAADLISSVLGGGETSVASAVDSVSSGFGGGMLGLLGLGGGGGDGAEDEPSSTRSIMTTSGAVNIVPDARLNALIVQATPVDLRLIEMILEKVDREESPEDVQTVARPQLIPVIYQDANEIAEVVKAVFADRIQGAAAAKANAGPPSPQEFLQAIRGRGGKGKESKPTSQPNQISVAVDRRSNVLVIVATPQDFAEVRELVETLDQEGMESEETIVTHTMDGSVNPEVLRLALESILGKNAGTTSRETSSSASNDNANRSETTNAAADIQRRMEFFKALRDRSGEGGSEAGGSGGSSRLMRALGGQRGGGRRGGGQRGGSGGGRGN